jgi:hypothetical protein
MTYDLSLGDIIRYKNFRIQILEGANEWIRYKVIEDGIENTEVQ